MSQIILVNFDRDTINGALLNLILKNNLSITHSFDNFYEFEFDPVEFGHALCLFSKLGNPLDFDLSGHLPQAKFIFENLADLGEYKEHIKKMDRKRHSMEDLGVSLSSMFMVKSFGIPWQNISYVPTDITLDKESPDFIAIHGALKYFYESKGTTRSLSIKKFMEKGRSQVKSIRENSLVKFAFVSYIPVEKLAPPPTMFISDPPTDHLLDLQEDMVQRLHFALVLKYSHFKKTHLIYRKILKEQFHLRYSNKGKAESVSTEIDSLMKKMQISFKNESENLESYHLRDMIFVGNSTRISFENGTIRIFQGIEERMLNKIVNLEQNLQFLNNESDFETVQASIFSDGTIFVIEYDYKSEDSAKGLPEKPDPLTSFYKSRFEVSKYEPISDFSRYEPSSYNASSKDERAKIPILVRR